VGLPRPLRETHGIGFGLDVARSRETRGWARVLVSALGISGLTVLGTSQVAGGRAHDIEERLRQSENRLTAIETLLGEMPKRIEAADERQSRAIDALTGELRAMRDALLRDK
jgi:hypothetical protein